jgi:3-isopropylmalate/(R)-2-methylmalate dehydratase small subunit
MSLKPFTVVSGPAPYLARANLDTDVIIRIDRLTALKREELGPYALEALRYLADGIEDPEFVLNDPHFRNAPILLGGENFGCGSSREGAVWALQGAGFRCVIAPSFGDIFFSNCFQNGVLPIRLNAEQVAALSAACSTGKLLKVDLWQCEITDSQGCVMPFVVDPSRREGLLHGLDDIGLTLSSEPTILAWQRKDRHTRPWAWPTTAPLGHSLSQNPRKLI